MKLGADRIYRASTWEYQADGTLSRPVLREMAAVSALEAQSEWESGGLEVGPVSSTEQMRAWREWSQRR
jgi:hypothetical protein